MGLVNLALNVIDPFKIYRNYIIGPIFDIFYAAIDGYKARTKDSVSSVKDVLLKVGVGLFAAAIIIWTAIFMYIAFYYAYMPAVAHMRPVYMQFKACDEMKGPCSFPSAHVSLTKKQQLLMVGQPYKVIVNIDMPESPQNRDLGMFMVCAEMRDQSTNLRGHSCRSAMLHYRSNLATTITTWVTSPLIIMGAREEKQDVFIELFSNYEDEQSHPVTDVYVEIQSKQIQFYSVSLHITAHFTGLRYIMFHWPILSATLGITTNLFFLLLVCLLSWYHWSDTTWIDEAKEKYKKIRLKTGSGSDSGNEKRRNYSSSIEDSNQLLDDDEISLMEEIKSVSSIEDEGDTTLRKRKEAGDK